jgi:hypothetical protein
VIDEANAPPSPDHAIASRSCGSAASSANFKQPARRASGEVRTAISRRDRP